MMIREERPLHFVREALDSQNNLQMPRCFCYSRMNGKGVNVMRWVERSAMAIESDIGEIIRERGPLTGSELLEAIPGDALPTWRACMLAEDLTVHSIGPRYLRLDRRINGFGRLSPSILREFLTYSVIGQASDPDATFRRGEEIRRHIEQVTRSKSQLAYEIISAAMEAFDLSAPMHDQVAVMIAGDIVYNMAHDVPRPERSTGRMVRGSDMDIVVVVDDPVSDDMIDRLDDVIYREKQRILMAPHLREEIDYIVKNMDRIREQLRFDSFRRMVACKILQEATLLYGSERLFRTVKTILKASGVTAQLAELEDRARNFRERAVRDLLAGDADEMTGAFQDLFYPTEESEEFE
jgi:hypothetical protein